MTVPAASPPPASAEASASPDASFFALPRGYIIRASAFGLLFMRAWKPKDSPGRHGGIIYVEIADGSLGFFEGKQGALKRRPGRLLARYPLADLRSWDLKDGFLTSSLAITVGADSFSLTIQRNQRKQAAATTKWIGSHLALAATPG